MATRHTANSIHLEEYCSRFQSLHTAQHQGRPRPHKAVMLLTVLSLADNGLLAQNRITYSDELLEIFARFFDIVCGPTDRRTPWNPFFFMKSEGFWELHPQPGQDAVLAAMHAPGGVGALSTAVSCASLEPELFSLVAQEAPREVLRQALIDRYFSQHREALLAVCGEEKGIGKVRDRWRANDYVVDRGQVPGTTRMARTTAFARTVREAYDYRCAACGIRFRYEDITVIDAAHLVPFDETQDDSPQNGMALCKNHHWIMDRNLMSPGPGPGAAYGNPRWYICKNLDTRIEGQREILELKGTPVIMPADERLWPKREALDRRMELLKEKCG